MVTNNIYYGNVAPAEPLYQHNVAIYYCHGDVDDEGTYKPNQDGSSRCAFTLINSDPEEYSLSTSSEDIDKAWQLLRLYWAIQLDSTLYYSQEGGASKYATKARPCTGKSYYADETGNEYLGDNFKIFTKHFTFSGEEPRRLLVIHFLPAIEITTTTTDGVTTTTINNWVDKDFLDFKPVEISCGCIKPMLDANSGTETEVQWENQEEFEDNEFNYYDNYFCGQKLIVLDVVEEIK